MKPLLIRLACCSLAAWGAALAQTAPMPAVIPASAPPPVPSGASAGVTVKLIAFNDYHGNLESPGRYGANTAVPPAQRPAVGGAEFMAAAVARLKAQNPRNAVVGAGDAIGASPLISSLFHDEPAVETLNLIGLEFNAVGNHEFDKGVAELRRLQEGGCKRSEGQASPNSCKGLGSSAPGRFDGARFQWLAANVVESASGKTLFPAYGIKAFDGLQVAFIGMTLRGTPRIVMPTSVAGLRFRDEAATVNALVPELRAQGVGAIVVLMHQGGEQEGTPAHPTLGDINGCDGDLAGSEIARIVAGLDDAVDLVISGHTHAAYNCSATTRDVADGGSTARPTGLPNKVGRKVPVTSARSYGSVLTDIDLTLDPQTGRVLEVRPTNRLVDRGDPELSRAVAAEPRVAQVVAGYRALATPVGERVIGRIAAAVPNAPSESGESAAGDLVADAQLHAAQPAAMGGAVLALMNPGGVRAAGLLARDGAYPKDVSYAEAYTLQPFGNTLMAMTLTGRQLKALLEQQFPGCMGQGIQRILQVSNGLRYRWRASAPPCERIVDATLTPMDLASVPPKPTGPPVVLVRDGVLRAAEQRFRVVVNSYIAAGGDGFKMLTDGTDVQGGVQDIDALAGYLGAVHRPPNPPYDPSATSLNVPRITRLP